MWGLYVHLLESISVEMAVLVATYYPIHHIFWLLYLLMVFGVRGHKFLQGRQHQSSSLHKVSNSWQWLSVLSANFNSRSGGGLQWNGW
jgi:hypothetical protein